MQETDPSAVTLYLRQLHAGDRDAIHHLLPLVYSDLKWIAQTAFRQQWRNHTLQPTALVHEAYLRLVHPDAQEYENRRHFLAVASLAMRQLLQDYARLRNAEKREGGHGRVDLETLDLEAVESEIDLVELDEAMTSLEALHTRQARIVELRFFTGMSVEETARVLEISERTVHNDWNMARAWLERRLELP